MRIITTSIMIAVCGGAASADTSFDWGELDAWVESRLRYEFVDQAGIERNANAVTFRARYGGELKTKAKLNFLVEGESVFGLVTDFNDTRNRDARFPVVPDPTNTELNRAQISYQPMDDLKLTVGRQYVNMGGQRLIGSVAFRQNNQTFDGVQVEYNGIKGVKAKYAYINQVNRLFGQGDKLKGRFHGDIHAYQVDWKPIDEVTLSGFGLMLQLNEAPVLDTGTHGAAVTVKLKNGLNAVGAYAKQKDRANNPLDINLDYRYVHVGYDHKKFAIKAALESLEGNGEMGIMGPLGTLHKFQGFADVFLSTPVEGLDDYYVQGTLKLGDVGPFKGVKLSGWYHEFEQELDGVSLGDEIDFALSTKISKNVWLLVKYASYSGVPGYASRDKFWFGINSKF